ASHAGRGPAIHRTRLTVRPSARRPRPGLATPVRAGPRRCAARGGLHRGSVRKSPATRWHQDSARTPGAHVVAGVIHRQHCWTRAARRAGGAGARGVYRPPLLAGGSETMNRRGRAGIRGLLTVAALLAMLPGTSWADSKDDDPLPPVRPPDGNKIKPQKPERELRQILRDIDAKNVERSITTLAGFGTRHLESSQTDPNQGIGAAINFVFNTLQGYAANSGGRMTVEKQTFHLPQTPGAILNPAGVDVTNV